MHIFDVRDVEFWARTIQDRGYRARHLCAAVGCSQRQLQRYTRAVFGLSPQALVNEFRLAVAPALLIKHRLAKEVAFELGFRQASHFSRAFKIKYGVSARGFLEARQRRNVGGPKESTKMLLRLARHPLATADNKCPP